MTRHLSKKGNEIIDLVDDIIDHNNPFKDTFKTDPVDIFIDDNLLYDFDQNNKKDIKMVSDDILWGENIDQNDALFEELSTPPVRCQIVKPDARLELMANKNFKKCGRQRNRKDKKRHVQGLQNG